MNREALAQTDETGEAHYWSRSRDKLWRKGEESGHVQSVSEIRLDCDGDAIVLDRRAGGRHRVPHRATSAASSASSKTARGMMSSPC